MSPYEIRGYQKYLKQESTIVFSGNPLMYELRRAIDNETHLLTQFKSILLWAPHWSKDWINEAKGFAQWRRTIGAVYEFAYSNPTIEVIVRPHPILREAILATLFENREMTNWESLKSIDLELDHNQLKDFSKLLNLPNVKMSSNTLLEDVLKATHLVTDGVSIIGYWATTGKPMLVIEGEEGSPFNEDGKLIVAETERAVSSREIGIWLNKLDLHAPVPTNFDLKELSEKLHPTFPKSPMHIFLESIN
jgi:hypothetical protein